MSKLLYNVGAFVGLSGTGVLYLGQTDAGAKFLFSLNEHDGNESTPPIPAFISVSSVLNAIKSGVAGTQIARVIKFADLAETAPVGMADSNGVIQITNAPGTAGSAAFPRVSTGSITIFAIKGSDVTTPPTDKTIVTAGTVDAWEAGTILDVSNLNTVDTDGDGIPDAPAPAADTSFTGKLADFAKENPYTVIGLAIAITILIVLLYQYFFQKKKGKKRR